MKNGKIRLARKRTMFRRKRTKKANKTPLSGVKVSRINYRDHKSSSTPSLPVAKFCVLPYYEYGAVSTGANLANAQLWSANGLYDPNISSIVVGHQPMGFDQMMLFYEHYTVYKAIIEVTFYNLSASQNIVGGVYVSADATIITDIEQLNENGLYSKASIPTIAGDNFRTVVLECNIAKVNGVPHVIGEDNFRGDVANNPSEQTYFHTFVYCPTSSSLVNVTYESKITYFAKFTEPRKMIKS